MIDLEPCRCGNTVIEIIDECDGYPEIGCTTCGLFIPFQENPYTTWNDYREYRKAAP